MMRRCLTFLRYSQQPKKNVFIMPMKYDIPTAALAEVHNSTISASDCRMLAFLLRDNIQYFHGEALGTLYWQLSKYNLEITDEFHSIIVPITLEYLKLFNRGNSQALYQIAYTAAKLKIDNSALWADILKKLDEENIYKYISLMDTVNLMEALIKDGRFVKTPLMAKLQAVIYQHKLYYVNFPNVLTKIKNLLTQLQQIIPKDQQLKISEAYKQIV